MEADLVIDRALSLGRELVDGSELPTDRRLELLEAYTEAVGDVMARTVESSEPSVAALLALHREVLDVAEKLMAEEKGQLVQLRQRERGLRAYLDTLPRKLQTQRTRKG